MVEIMITQSDLLAAVIEALEAAPAESDGAGGALRTVEIAEALGLSRGRTTALLRKLLAEGRLAETRKTIRRLGGDMVRVCAYRLRRQGTTDGE